MAERPKLAQAMRDDHKIVIRQIAGMFSVAIEPPMPDHDLGGTFAVWKAARGHASGIRLIHRLPIQDLTCSEGLGA